MNFKKVFSWKSDDMPETTDAVVVVSNCGVVKCLEYKLWNKHNNNYSTRKERVYQKTFNRGKQRFIDSENKYESVTIRDKTYYVHVLVALAWIPNPEKKPQVNHKNGIKNDNRIENLEWVTNLENRRHAITENLPRKSIEKVSDDDVLTMKKLKIEGYSNPEIGKIFNITGECVRYRTSKIMTKDEIDLANKKARLK